MEGDALTRTARMNCVLPGHSTAPKAVDAMHKKTAAIPLRQTSGTLPPESIAVTTKPNDFPCICAQFQRSRPLPIPLASRAGGFLSHSCHPTAQKFPILVVDRLLRPLRWENFSPSHFL